MAKGSTLSLEGDEDTIETMNVYLTNGASLRTGNEVLFDSSIRVNVGIVAEISCWEGHTQGVVTETLETLNMLVQVQFLATCLLPLLRARCRRR